MLFFLFSNPFPSSPSALRHSEMGVVDAWVAPAGVVEDVLAGGEAGGGEVACVRTNLQGYITS